MAALSIGGNTVSVQRARRVRVPLAVSERMQDGSLVSARPGARADHFEWEVDAGILSTGTASTLVTVLTAPGSFTATGDIVGGSVTALGTEVETERGELPGHVYLRFRMREVI